MDNALTKRLGPLPLWGWGAVGVGLVALLFMMRHRGGVNAALPGGALPVGADTGGSSSGGGSAPPPVGDIVPGHDSIISGAPIWHWQPGHAFPIGGFGPGMGPDWVPGSKLIGGQLVRPDLTLNEMHPPPTPLAPSLDSVIKSVIASSPSNFQIAPDNNPANAGGFTITSPTGTVGTHNGAPQQQNVPVTLHYDSTGHLAGLGGLSGGGLAGL